jgi:hypothetical protein
LLGCGTIAAAIGGARWRVGAGRSFERWFVERRRFERRSIGRRGICDERRRQRRKRSNRQRNGLRNAGTRSLLPDVDVADLVPGTNTLELTTSNAPMSYPPVVLNVDLILQTR